MWCAWQWQNTSPELPQILRQSATWFAPLSDQITSCAGGSEGQEVWTTLDTQEPLKASCEFWSPAALDLSTAGSWQRGAALQRLPTHRGCAATALTTSARAHVSRLPRAFWRLSLLRLLYRPWHVPGRQDTPELFARAKPPSCRRVTGDGVWGCALPAPYACVMNAMTLPEKHAFLP